MSDRAARATLGRRGPGGRRTGSRREQLFLLQLEQRGHPLAGDDVAVILTFDVDHFATLDRRRLENVVAWCTEIARFRSEQN